MTRKALKVIGHLTVMMADGSVTSMPIGVWKRIVWVKGPHNLLTLRDAEDLKKPAHQRQPVKARLENIKAKTVRVGPTKTMPLKEWYKPVDVDSVRIQLVQNSDLSPDGKQKLTAILERAAVAYFKNDCGDLGSKYIHTIEGGVHPPVRQYPLNPEAVAEMETIVKELLQLGIIREESNPVTNSPIQAVKKPEASGGGWRPVINFKALNRRTVANRASLINPQASLKTLRVKKYKSCIDLANGFFSLRLAKTSQGKTAFTHKGKSYVWQRLPQGYKNSPNVFQSAVLQVLSGLDVTVYIDDVFVSNDEEEEHLDLLQKVVERVSAAGLKLNLKKCQLARFQVDYLGFQVTENLGISEGFRQKIEQISPPRSETELQRILGLCNYVRDHIPHYQKHARPLYGRLKKTPEGQKPTKWQWSDKDNENLNNLKQAVREAVRLEPRSLTGRLVAKVQCEENDAMVSVSNEGAGLVALWTYTLSSVEKKFPQEEKELAVLARYWSNLKDLAQGQGIKVQTGSNVHRFLRKTTIESTKATNIRWGRWEDILLDPDLEIGPNTTSTKKPIPKKSMDEEKPYEWTLYTDGSKKEGEQNAHWGFILKQNGVERCRRKGKTPGSAQAGEATAVLEGLLEAEKNHAGRVRLITDSHYCAQALKFDLAIWEENGFEGAKGKLVAHYEVWKKIAELRLNLSLDVVHQKSHVKEGAHWRGNNEVDRYVQERRIIVVGAEKWDKTPRGKVVPDKSVRQVVSAVHEALGHAGPLPTRKELEKLELWVPDRMIRAVLRDCNPCNKYNAGRRGRRTDGLTIRSTVPWGSVCMDVAGPMGVSGAKGEKYLVVLVDSMSGHVGLKAVRKANANSVIKTLEDGCMWLGIPKELRTDNGTHFKNAQVDEWCRRWGIVRVYSPPYTPQANGVAERSIGLVKTWLGKNANGKEWSTKLLDLVADLNGRSRSSRPSPSEELNQRLFVSQEVGRTQDSPSQDKEKCRFSVGQKVWIKSRDLNSNTAVKAKYDCSDIVSEVLDRNTVRLKKKGIQGVEQLKPLSADPIQAKK
nr:uncharacterized protein LOC125982043 [Syngnathus scovelli]